MFETETTRLLEMRIRARRQPVVLAHIDQALSILSRLSQADGEEEDFDDLEVAIESLASAIGHRSVRH